jgi:hypothetical protein
MCFEISFSEFERKRIKAEIKFVQAKRWLSAAS